MTQLQWTIASVFGGVLVLGGAAWRLATEGFSWGVVLTAFMVILILGGVWRRARTPMRARVWSPRKKKGNKR